MAVAPRVTAGYRSPPCEAAPCSSAWRSGSRSRAPPARWSDPAARTRLTTLDNGLRILTLEDRTTPVVSYQSWVHVGSGDEARWTGVAHLFEHMMFRGTKRVPGDLRDRLLRERGSRGTPTPRATSPSTSRTPAPSTCALVIDLEADRFRHLVISPVGARHRAPGGARGAADADARTTPQGRLIESLLALSFLAHPYRTPTIGWQSDVEKVDAETCREFFRAYYVPNNIVVSIAGDFDEDGGDRAPARAPLRLRAAGPGPAAQPDARSPPSAGERRAVVHVPVRAPLVGVGWHAPATGHPDGPALDAARRDPLLGAHQPAPAQARLRGARGALGLRRLLGARARRSLLRRRRRPAGQVPEQRRGRAVRRDRAGCAPRRRASASSRRRSEGFEVSLTGHLRTANALASRNAEELLSFGRIRSLDERIEKVARRDRRRRAARRPDLPRAGAAHASCTCSPPTEPRARGTAR